MNTYRVLVLNRDKRVIQDGEIKGHKLAMETARNIPEAVDIAVTRLSPDNFVGYYEHKFQDGWKGITRERFHTKLRKGGEHDGCYTLAVDSVAEKAIC